MKLHSDYQYNLLKRFLEGTATESEEQLVREWMNDPEQEIRLRYIMTRIFGEMEKVEKWTDSEDSLRQIHRKIDQRKSIRPDFFRILKNAGSIAAILLIPLLTYISINIFKDEGGKSGINASQAVYNEIFCPPSARCQFELSDGTKVWLNNGSKLKYPVFFEGNSRIVELSGEAYFDVKTDKTNPFIIKTQGLNIKVTGTRLNVNAYPAEKFQEVVVDEGTVELIEKDKLNQNSLVKLTAGQYALNKEKNCPINFNLNQGNKKLNPKIIKDKDQLNSILDKLETGESALYEQNDYSLLLKYEKGENYSAWRNGKLVLRNDPMTLMLNRIERWYNVKFDVIDNNIYKYSYWATFENENIHEVLNLLNIAGPVGFKVEDREIKEDGSLDRQVVRVFMNGNK